MTRYPLPKAVAMIVASMVVTAGASRLALRYGALWREGRRAAPITTIVQAGDLLPTEYLAERLGLSVDAPLSLDTWNEEEARQTLTRLPRIRSISSCFATRSGSLFLSFEARYPRFFSGDYSGLAFDEEGTPIPLLPGESDLPLPTVYFGFPDPPAWDTPIDATSMRYAKTLIDLMIAWRLPVTTIDLSRLCAPSLGSREIVVTLDHHLVRLSPEGVERQIGDYLELKGGLAAHTPHVIDMRLPHAAYIAPQYQ